MNSEFDFSKMSLQSLMALRDISSDSLREAEKTVEELRAMGIHLKEEIASRGKNTD